MEGPNILLVTTTIVFPVSTSPVAFRLLKASSIVISGLFENLDKKGYTPHSRCICLYTASFSVNANIGHFVGLREDRTCVSKPVLVKAIIPALFSSCAKTTADLKIFVLGVHSSKSLLYSVTAISSMAQLMLFMTSMHLIGYFPIVVSAESMIASAFSLTALATSETSARVGSGELIIDSSICVATITGFVFLIDIATAVR